jgi:hypothetical protein
MLASGMKLSLERVDGMVEPWTMEIHCFAPAVCIHQLELSFNERTPKKEGTHLRRSENVALVGGGSRIVRVEAGLG